jgi:hypothetical protein
MVHVLTEWVTDIGFASAIGPSREYETGPQ